MNYPYLDRVAHYKKKTLAQAFAMTLGVIPHALGHFLDTVLLLDGLFGSADVEKETFGPFSVLFSSPFRGLGFLMGQLTQIIIDIPSYVGYSLDLLITGIARVFSLSFNGKLDPDSFTQFHQWFTKRNDRSFFYHHPTSMNGPFGYLLGTIPQLLQTTIVFSFAHLTTIAQTALNLPVQAINLLKDTLYNLFFPKKIHTLFPTMNQTKKNPTLAYFNHLPIIAKISLDNNESFNLLSYNLLEKNIFSRTYNQKDYESGVRENENGIKDRYTKIANGLKKAVDKQGISVILLQKVQECIEDAIDTKKATATSNERNNNDGSSNFFLSLLTSVLGKNWKVKRTKDGLVSCFDKNQWNANKKPIYDVSKITHQLVLNHKVTGKVVCINNVCSANNPLPHHHETYYRGLLQDLSYWQDLNVVMGDTNSRIAPLHNQPHNITTAAIPPGFDENYNDKTSTQRQKADHPNGGFYCYPLRKNIYQLKNSIINPKTGATITDHHRRRRYNVFEDYRMILCLDDSYHKKPFINGQTLFQYEDFLRNRYNDHHIIVRIATTSFNEKAIAIGFTYSGDGSIYDVLKNELGQSIQTRRESDLNSTIVYDCIFCPLDNVHKLDAIFSQYTLQQNTTGSNDEKQSASVETPLHPLIPTLTEAEKNPDIVYSDHLPLITEVPLGKNDSHSFHALTYNILGKSSCSGLHHYNNKNWENDDAFKARYTRIAEGLKKTTDNDKKLSMIFLQEVSEKINRNDPNEPDFTAPLLQKKLGDEWTVMNTKERNITCFRKQDWMLKSDTFDKRTRTHHVILYHIKTNSIVKFHNVWSFYNEFPHHHEKRYRDLLHCRDNQQALNVVIGDTNSRIAPLHYRSENITTGAIPPFADEIPTGTPDHQLQQSDHPDGGFYCGKDEKIYQLITHVVDLSHGSIHHDHPNTDKTSYKGGQKYRMVMCLDNFYRHEKLINNKTLFEYETWLQDRYFDEDIIVRSATTSFNDKGIGIRFAKKSPVFQALLKELNEQPGFQMNYLLANNRETQPDPCLFCSLDKVNILHNTIKAVAIEKTRSNKKQWHNFRLRETYRQQQNKVNDGKHFVKKEPGMN